MIQKQIWISLDDLVKFRKLKDREPDGNLESDAKAFNKLLKSISDKFEETSRKAENTLNIRFDGRIR
jgi:glutathionylspermidine synthase